MKVGLVGLMVSSLFSVSGFVLDLLTSSISSISVSISSLNCFVNVFVFASANLGVLEGKVWVRGELLILFDYK